ncbi:ankyrin repeat-containing domain protein [Aspergillus pseudoustus]|uniref:Ankyrin repeat-containing domain protein n=1 Tax=Aspergillus pseudoustus TaxID=1810923 RepID=A0ABR4IZM5_9EURO
MDQTILPFDLQYRILAEISQLDLLENAQANWGQILNFFCVSRLWHSSLQDLLILHHPAYSLLRTSRKIGHLALKRLIADYEASKEECNNTEQPILFRPRTYSAKQDPDHSDNDGPFRHDLKMCSRAAAYRGYLDSLKLCLDSKTHDDMNFLLLNAINGDSIPVLGLLFDGGFADLQTEAGDAGIGDSVLGYAVQQNRAAIADFLLNRGASLNIRIAIQLSRFERSLSPLSFAAMSGNTEVVQVLLAHGADVENSRRLITRAVDWPIRHGNVDMVRVFMEYGVDLGPADYREECWPLYEAVGNEDLDMVKLLIEEGSPNVKPHGYDAEIISEVLECCESEELKQYLEPHLR